MICKITSVDLDNGLASVCNAADKESYDNNKGQFFVGFFKRIRPLIGKSYSVRPRIYWQNGKKLVHGDITGAIPMEDLKRYKING